jgi:hypothetical protein
MSCLFLALPPSALLRRAKQMQSLAPHKHARLKSQSSSDTGAQSSNGTSAGGPTGNAGSKLDITA